MRWAGSQSYQPSKDTTGLISGQSVSHGDRPILLYEELSLATESKLMWYRNGFKVPRTLTELGASPVFSQALEVAGRNTYHSVAVGFFLLYDMSED